MRETAGRARSTGAAALSGSAPPEGSPPRPQGLALTAVCLGFFMVLMDSSALNVALPRIASQYAGGLGPIEWTVNAYTITMAACLLGGGALADRLGARRLYQVSLLVFVASSAACAAAPGLGVLIGARAVQGLGAGGLLPASLAVIAHMYTDPARRAKAFTVWGGVSSLALVTGPVIGGALTATTGWRSIFLINVPVGLLAALLCRWKVAPAPARPAPLDPAGQAAAFALVGCGIGALVEGGIRGWTAPLTLALVAVTVVAGAVFVVTERRVAHPMLPLGVFRRPGFTPALALGALYQFGAYGAQFAISLHLQRSWGMGALGAGLALAPFAASWSFASFVLARTMGRGGPRRPLVGGAATAAVGAAVLLPLGAGHLWWLFFTGSCLLGLGAGLMGPSLPSVTLRALPAHRSGLASGSLNAFRQVGGSVAIALFGPIVTHTAGGLGLCLGLVAAGFAGFLLVARRTLGLPIDGDDTR